MIGLAKNCSGVVIFAEFVRRVRTIHFPLGR